MRYVHIKAASTVFVGCTSRRQLPSFQVPKPRLESSLEQQQLMDMDGVESGYGCCPCFGPQASKSWQQKEARRRDSVSSLSHHDGRPAHKLSRCFWIVSLYLVLPQQLQFHLFVAHASAESITTDRSLSEVGSPCHSGWVEVSSETLAALLQLDGAIPELCKKPLVLTLSCTSSLAFLVCDALSAGSSHLWTPLAVSARQVKVYKLLKQIFKSNLTVVVTSILVDTIR